MLLDTISNKLIFLILSNYIKLKTSTEILTNILWTVKLVKIHYFIWYSLVHVLYVTKYILNEIIFKQLLCYDFCVKFYFALINWSSEIGICCQNQLNFYSFIHSFSRINWSDYKTVQLNGVYTSKFLKEKEIKILPTRFLLKMKGYLDLYHVVLIGLKRLLFWKRLTKFCLSVR